MATALANPQGLTQKPVGFFKKPGAWVDLCLTLPVFVLYHLGVVQLGVRNGTDLVTGPLFRVAEGNVYAYFGITLGLGLAFGLVFFVLGRGQGFRLSKLLQIMLEGVVYAVVMRIGAAYLVGRLFAGPMDGHDPYRGLIMSLGAGFYEELAFRVVLFGLIAKGLVWIFTRQRVSMVGKSPTGMSFRAMLIIFGWSLVAASVFSGVHYIGSLGDKFLLTTFVFRLVLGLALSLIYVTRGFAAAVWAHALYDIWVLVL